MTASLLTWLCQGLVLTCALGATLRVMPRLNAATRHWIWWGAFGALAALGASGATGATGAQLADGAQPFLIPSAPDTVLRLLLGVWAAVTLVFHVRLIPSVHAVFALRDRCRPFPAEVEAELPLWLEQRAHGRPARLMLCDAVPGATMLGFHRPCIVMPGSLIRALTRDELDQVVLHEYAHVQRWDDWIRLAQALLQSALWIHPAVAFIGRELNLEREAACDEWVVSRTGRPRAYAICLTRAVAARHRSGVELMLGPALFGRRHDLVRRVERLLETKGKTRRTVSLLAAVGSACALAAMTALLRSAPSFEELVDGPLPTVSASAVSQAPVDVRPTPLPMVARPLVAGPRLRSHGITGITRAGRVEPVASTAQVAQVAPAQVAPVAPLAPNTVAPAIATRTFGGRYPAPAPVLASVEPQRPWRMAGTAGAEMGAAAGRTGTELARAFARAGMSLARRF